MAVTVVWSIKLEPHPQGGSLVEFIETASGSSRGQLDKIALAVDGVKQQAIENLVKSHND